MNKTDTAIERLKALGFDQEKIDGTLEIVYKEVQDDLIGGLVDNSTEEEINEYVNRIKAAKSADHMMTLIQEIAAKVYGENAQAQLDTVFAEKLGAVEEMTKNIKETWDKYQAGDPETVKAVEEAKNTQEAQDIAEALTPTQEN